MFNTIVDLERIVKLASISGAKFIKKKPRMPQPNWRFYAAHNHPQSWSSSGAHVQQYKNSFQSSIPKNCFCSATSTSYWPPSTIRLATFKTNNLALILRPTFPTQPINLQYWSDQQISRFSIWWCWFILFSTIFTQSNLHDIESSQV